MLNFRERSAAQINNPDTNEKTLFLDTDGLLDKAGIVIEVFD